MAYEIHPENARPDPRLKRPGLLLLILCILAFAGPCPVEAGLPLLAASQAFVDVPAPAGKASSGVPNLESRAVRVSPQVLDRLRSALPGEPPIPVLFNLSKGRTVQLRVERRYPTLGGGQVLFASVEGEAGAQAVLAVRAGSFAARFHLREGVYRVSPLGEGIHRVSREDPSWVLPEGEEPGPEPPAVEAFEEGHPPYIPQDASSFCPESDSYKINHILVLYTAQARTQAGGIEGIRASIDLALGVMNAALYNSQVGLEMRLVHCAETAYTDSGTLQVDLGRLSTVGDGYLEEVPGLMTTYGAQFACVFVGTSSGNIGGIAFRPGKYSVVYEPYAEVGFAH